MKQSFYSIYTENPTETSTSYYTDTMLSKYASEEITESIHNNTLISSINSMVSFQNNLKQHTSGTKELPNEILLKIFNNMTDLEDILSLRSVNKKFKSLSEVKLYDIIEDKIKSLENKKKSLERRLSHMKNHLCPRLSHYKVFLNVISRSDVSELCNLPKPPREVKYIFSVLYILYTGGKNCQCEQCLQNKITPCVRGTKCRSNSICCGVMHSKDNDKKMVSRRSFCVSELSTRNSSPFGGSSNNSSRGSSRRNSIDQRSSTSSSTIRTRKGSVQSDIGVSTSSSSSFGLDKKTNDHTQYRTNRSKSLSTPPKEQEQDIEIPNWEEVRQVINKNDFRNWVMTLHSKLDTVPKEHILLANNLLNKPRATTNSKAHSTASSSASSQSEYENLRLTYDRMLIVSQIGYKILLFIEAIIQSFFLTERFEEQKNSISQVYEQIHQWKDLQLQCKN
ncbi:hypothetical protein PIROE2DRAFT_15989 [Piromyces sp. E2]|nr:hypothetical protein PIROE2DRAFT_15989 [Piromyces sp. E2]|eukprot:OUM58679.1 hypothetical protein PIROE2DRAFT_15989 [Piromyces sp. E2]